MGLLCLVFCINIDYTNFILGLFLANIDFTSACVVGDSSSQSHYAQTFAGSIKAFCHF